PVAVGEGITRGAGSRTVLVRGGAAGPAGPAVWRASASGGNIYRPGKGSRWGSGTGWGYARGLRLGRYRGFDNTSPKSVASASDCRAQGHPGFRHPGAAVSFGLSASLL